MNSSKIQVYVRIQTSFWETIFFAIIVLVLLSFRTLLNASKLTPGSLMIILF